MTASVGVIAQRRLFARLLGRARWRQEQPVVTERPPLVDDDTVKVEERRKPSLLPAAVAKSSSMRSGSKATALYSRFLYKP